MENQFQLNKLLKYGVIISLVSIIYTVILYVVDITMMVSFWNLAISLLISIGLLIWATLSYRKEVGGYLTFKNAFLSVFVMSIISGIIGTAFTILLFGVIDPTLPDTLKDATIEMTERMMSSMGAPEDQIDKTLAEIEEKDQFSPANMLKSNSINILVFSLIISLIFGAIFKKSKPEVE
jgi:hypothetical protein